MAIPRRQVFIHKKLFSSLMRNLVTPSSNLEGTVALCQRMFEDYLGVRHALVVGSGRQGLRLLLRGLELPKNSTILVPAYTYRAVVEAVVAEGFVPEFIDITSSDHNLDLDAAERKASTASALIATHLFGNPLDMARTLELAQAHKLVVIEDCAHALGAEFQGRKVGSFGIGGFFSFGATKVFNTFGGGLVVTSDSALAQKLRTQTAAIPPLEHRKLVLKALTFSILALLTKPAIFSISLYPLLLLLDKLNLDVIELYGRLAKPSAEVGLVSRGFTDLQAHWAVQGINSLDDDLHARRRIFHIFDEAIPNSIQRLRALPDSQPAPYFYVILSARRDRLARELLRAGIDTGHNIMDDCPAMFGCQGDFPQTVRARRESLQIPVFPWYGEREVQKISACLQP